MPHPLSLVWTHEPNKEYRDWLLYLLDPLLRDQRQVDRPVSAEPHTLYIVSTNSTPLADFPSAFYESVRRTPGVGLFVGDDEWFSGDYAAYRHFAYVLRCYHHPRFRRRGIFTLPLGYTNDLSRPDELRPASARRYLWFFAGKLVGSRPEMLNAFRPLEPHLALVPSADGQPGPRLSKSEFHATLADSVFAPCPMGNVVLETFRFYEALENGTIPLVERRPFRNYYADFFGKHPVPTFASWNEAANFVRTMKDNHAELDALQERVTAWWRWTKEAMKADLHAFLEAGMDDAYRVDMAAFPYTRNRVLRKVEQAVELGRHHSWPAAARRVRMSATRLATTGSIISAQRRERKARGQARLREGSDSNSGPN
jgi:hypothetical protein